MRTLTAHRESVVLANDRVESIRVLWRSTGDAMHAERDEARKGELVDEFLALTERLDLAYTESREAGSAFRQAMKGGQ